ncbi:MAG: hypothetical protein INH34_03290 [Phycisphaerales bacterium]|nr:hypothetical protein [Phycisphaerales bacterium]
MRIATCDRSAGVALLAVLFALTLLMLLALPFAVSMSVGADAAVREVEETSVVQAAASARELLLADAALSHPAIDPTPMSDGLEEFPQAVELPKAFQALGEDGRVVFGGGVTDLQRLFALDGASPLLFANVLGSTTRLREELLPDANEIAVDAADELPPTGMVFVGGELIRYGARTANALQQLERAVDAPEFGDGREPIPAQSLVLDWRCIQAANWPNQGSDPTRRTRQPFQSVGDLLAIERAGAGPFTPAEMDLLRASFTTDTQATSAPTWGRPERVFGALVAGESRQLIVKSALHLGPGSTVRLRNLRTGAVEHGLVVGTATATGQQAVQLPSTFLLNLLHRVLQDFPAVDTVVEPLIPAPINVNTASVEALTAVFAQLRQPPVVRQTESGVQRSTPPIFARAAARQLAEDIALLRAASDRPGTGAFTGWQDFVERLWRPRLEAAAAQDDVALLVNIYRNLHTGRDTVLEMGTAPFCFQSGPWMAYRAAASRTRSAVAPGVAARNERTGVALAVPGFAIERRWATQEQFEDALQLDRRSPFWATNPVNLGAIQPNALGADPASRSAPHLLAAAFPNLGFGQLRFPARDDVAAGIQPAPASALPGNWNRSPVLRVQESFPFAQDVRGHDVSKLGALRLNNTGPSQPQGQGGAPQQPSQRAVTQQGSGRHDQISFPFSTPDSFLGKFGLGAWLEPQNLAAVTLFEHGDGNDLRNRLAVEVRDGNLLLESIDEAGIDPNPSASPAGVQRTATQVVLPLAELAMPANTPLHVSFQAAGGRPSDLALHVDGFPRGRPRFQTYLTAAVPVFDPQRGNNQTLPGMAGNERYLDLQVESTDGFPPVGLLRIGVEYFEYTSIRGNTFRCQFNDSMGGRAARQRGREMRPDIPVDEQGRPRVDINSPEFANVNLDVFPAHPAGSVVELAGWSLPLSEDTPMMVGRTALDGSIGGWAVARGYIDNPRPITIQIPMGPSFPIGDGIDENWNGTLLLADPVPTGRTYPPPAAQEEIVNAFPATGGYALIVQGLQQWDRTLATTSASATFGGVEVIRYAARQGNQLTGVQRAQSAAIPGQDGQIAIDQFDGRPRRFVCNYVDIGLPQEPGRTFDDLPTEIVFVVPISLPVANTQVLWDPQARQMTEFCQLLPTGNAVDTEWVRYDVIAERRHIVRGNRAAWEALRFILTNRIGAAQIDVGPLGPNSQPSATTPPWPQVVPTSGYIGYVPQMESTWPQIHAARRALAFRGDPFTGTSSHPQASAAVLPCHRMQLSWGNFGVYTGRAGRHDRVAMVQGSTASGTQRPPVEWLSVNWACRRYEADNLQQGQTPPERLGPWPFQLVGFTDQVTNVYLGPPRGTPVFEPRRFDRLVKFPSGELPAAWCQQPTLGAGIGNAQQMQGYVDEVDLVQHARPTLVLDEDCADGAQTFRVVPTMLVASSGPVYFANDITPALPQTGGLVQIGGEVLAYQTHADGTFQVAINGRGLLNTQPRSHARGSRVEFLSHRSAAILASGLGIRDNTLPLQDLGALSPRQGTVLVGTELLHYSWIRRNGDQVQLEMPRHFPGEDEPGGGQPRGLFRGRFGTMPATAGAGQAVVGFPFRYWDRQVERSDDPELAYFQVTHTEAPGFFKSLRWRQETLDPRVDVVCLARVDGKLPWEGAPLPAGGFWELRGGSADAPPHRLMHHGSQLELRFLTRYQPGCVDLVTYRAHGWKTTARIEDVRVEYEGQSRVLVEEVTAR